MMASVETWAYNVAGRGARLEILALKLFFEKRGICRQVERSAAQLNRFDESIGVERDVDVAALPQGHISMVAQL